MSWRNWRHRWSKPNKRIYYSYLPIIRKLHLYNFLACHWASIVYRHTDLEVFCSTNRRRRYYQVSANRHRERRSEAHFERHTNLKWYNSIHGQSSTKEQDYSKRTTWEILLTSHLIQKEVYKLGVQYYLTVRQDLTGLDRPAALQIVAEGWGGPNIAGERYG